MYKLGLVFAAALCVPLAAAAQSFPSRTITLVVPYSAGGTNDIIARSVATKMSKTLGQAVVVENRSGAGGNVGAQSVARAPADGYTILTAPVGVLSVNKWLYPKLGYDAEKDFAPITLAGSVPNVLLVSPNVRAKNIQELIGLAKEHPNSITLASMGTGTTGHLCGEMFKMLAGIDLVHVAYRGSSPALQDLLGGHVNIMFDNLPTALPLAKAGSLAAFAVTGPKRSEYLPDVPTMAESGVKGFEATAWFGFVAPAATPTAILDQLNAEIASALNDPEVRERLNEQGLTVIANSREEFASFIASESVKWKEVVNRTGAKLE